METKVQGPFFSERNSKKSFFSKDRTWLNLLLFFVTATSCFFVGISWSLSYKYSDMVVQNSDFAMTARLVLNPEILLLSFLYVIVLMGILLAHELGHYFTCKYYKIDATLPFFIPAPTLIGTMGAFIKIRSPITQKHKLFDIGIAGPLASFFLGTIALFIGLYFSKVVPPLQSEGSIMFGEPFLLKLFSKFLFHGTPENYDIILHPVAFAGWVGVLVTSLNLFPVGQLDGGHIFYALFQEKSKRFFKYFIGLFLIMGIYFWIGWFVWALLISFMGVKHPPVLDGEIPLSKGRIYLAIFALVIFFLSFIPDPVQGYGLVDLLKGGFSLF